MQVVDLYSVNKLSRADEIRAQQRAFVMELLRAQVDKQVYYMDQTSIHLWNTARKTWTTAREPVTLPM